MTNSADRSPALAVLASMYQTSASAGDDYIARLWEKTFAEDLAWSVETATSSTRSLGEDAPPSWSWAALQILTPTSMMGESNKAEHFRLVEIGIPDRLRENLVDMDPIQRGALVKCVTIKARLQPLWNTATVFKLWPDISRTVMKREVYTFAQEPELSVYSTDTANGHGLTYEVRNRRCLASWITSKMRNA